MFCVTCISMFTYYVTIWNKAAIFIITNYIDFDITDKVHILCLSFINDNVWCIDDCLYRVMPVMDFITSYLTLRIYSGISKQMKQNSSRQQVDKYDSKDLDDTKSGTLCYTDKSLRSLPVRIAL